MGKTLWKSKNGKWEIVDDTDNLRFKTDWNDKNSTVARVSASDGWRIAYASIKVDGRIWTGDFNTNWEYFVPKTVSEKAFSLLRAMYKAKKPVASGKGQLPIQYVVMVIPKGTTKGITVPKPMFYRTFKTAAKHAEEEWAKLSAYQKNNGAYINVGRLSEPYATVRDIPGNFGYNLLGTLDKNDPQRFRKFKY